MKKVWRGKYDGVDFEINNFKLGDIDQWTFYLFIFLDRIPDKKLSKSFWLKPKNAHLGINMTYYDYYSHPIISEIDFHGGCTWYSKESGFDGEEKIIKVGCDYGHSCDEGNIYDLDDILSDVKKAINSFRKLVPNYKYWCCGNGKLYNKSEGVIKEDNFYSEEYYGKNSWFWELKEREHEKSK